MSGVYRYRVWILVCLAVCVCFFKEIINVVDNCLLDNFSSADWQYTWRVVVIVFVIFVILSIIFQIGGRRERKRERRHKVNDGCCSHFQLWEPVFTFHQLNQWMAAKELINTIIKIKLLIIPTELIDSIKMTLFEIIFVFSFKFCFVFFAVNLKQFSFYKLSYSDMFCGSPMLYSQLWPLHWPLWQQFFFENPSNAFKWKNCYGIKNVAS